jgi:hypothetical protein
MKYSFLILITHIQLSLHAQKKVKIDTSLKPLQYLLHILDTTNVKINNLKFVSKAVIVLKKIIKAIQDNSRHNGHQVSEFLSRPSMSAFY